MRSFVSLFIVFFFVVVSDFLLFVVVVFLFCFVLFIFFIFIYLFILFYFIFFFLGGGHTELVFTKEIQVHISPNGVVAVSPVSLG